MEMIKHAQVDLVVFTIQASGLAEDRSGNTTQVETTVEVPVSQRKLKQEKGSIVIEPLASSCTNRERQSDVTSALYQ